MTVWGHLLSRPAVMLALAAVAGISMASQLPPWPGLPWLLSVVVLVLTWKIWRTGNIEYVAAATVFIFALLHLQIRQGTDLHPMRDWLLKHPGGADVVAEGRVERPLRSDLPGAEPGKAMFVARRVHAPYAGVTWTGTTTLSLSTGQETTLAPGYYRLTGKLRLPYAADNPGQFDGRSYDLRLGLAGSLRLMTVESVVPDAWNLHTWLLSGAESCRAWVMRALSLDLDDAPDERTVILAMALGATDTASREIQEPFRLSGTLHIFAVSGLHVAIVAMVFWMLLKPLPLPRGVMLAILIFTLFGYAFLTGLRPSAVRAALMTSVFLCGAMFHRKSDLMSSLGLAALILLVYDTNQVFAPGFQLSFGVLAAIGLLNGPLMRPFERFTEPDPYLPKTLLTWWQKMLWKRKRQVAGLFTVSLAAWMGSLPFIIGHFQLATPISLLANMFLVPLSTILLFTAILTLICAGLHLTWFHFALSNANLGVAKLTIWFAHLFADVPGGNFYVPAWEPGARPPAEITVLRLPAGAAANHLRIGNQHWLLDTGAEEHYRYTVQAYLQHRGVNGLHGLILSHSDYEHTDAAPKVLADYGPEIIYQPAREPWRWETGNSAFRRLLAGKLPTRPLVAGDVVSLATPEMPEASATVLYPTADVWPRRSDDRTMVLRLDLGEMRVLWCNDAGFLAEKTMLESRSLADLRADVIIRNQHASDYSMLPEFLRAVRPQAIISSQQSFPPEQKINLRLREDCKRLGITLIDQGETGAVELRLWPKRVDIQGFRGMQSILNLPSRAQGNDVHD